MKKGYYRNFVSTVQHAAIVFALSVLYLFLSKEGQLYSRLSLVITFILYIFITYAVRELRKREMRKQMETGSKQSLFIVTTEDVAGQVVDRMLKNNYARYRIAGMAVIDNSVIGHRIHGVDEVADAATAVHYICRTWVDEVLIVISDSQPYPKKLIDQLIETGVTIHLNLAKVSNASGKKQFVEEIGPYTFSYDDDELCIRTATADQACNGHCRRTCGMPADWNYIYLCGTGHIYQFTGAYFLCPGTCGQERQEV